MNKIISLAIVLLFVAMAVSAHPRVQVRDLSFVAWHSNHTQVLGGHSDSHSAWGLENASRHSHGVCAKTPSDGGDGTGSDSDGTGDGTTGNPKGDGSTATGGTGK
jgi:hypothetical protein